MCLFCSFQNNITFLVKVKFVLKEKEETDVMSKFGTNLLLDSGTGLSPEHRTEQPENQKQVVDFTPSRGARHHVRHGGASQKLPGAVRSGAGPLSDLLCVVGAGR